jgi:alpha-L-rhamnosidase
VEKVPAAQAPALKGVGASGEQASRPQPDIARSVEKLWGILSAEFGPVRKKQNLHPQVHPANAFIGNYLRLELLSRHGEAALLLGELRDFFLYMAERTGTLWEHEDDGHSLNHGFASHVVHLLYRDVLGLFRVDAPGRSVILRFYDLPLSHCRGTRPVGSELLALDWKRAGNRLVWRLDAPSDFKVQVENPDGLDLVRETA